MLHVRFGGEDQKWKSDASDHDVVPMLPTEVGGGSSVAE